MTDDFEDKIRNWSAWARDRKITPISCRGLESQYKPPPMWEYPQLKAEVDINAAIKIERILVGETFPKKAMALIVYNYVYPWLNFQGALRKINRFDGEHVKQSNFDMKLEWAKRVLHNRLIYSD